MNIFLKALSWAKRIITTRPVQAALRLATGLSVGGATAAFAFDLGPQVQAIAGVIAGVFLSFKEIVKSIDGFFNKVEPFIKDIADDGKLNDSAK